MPKLIRLYMISISIGVALACAFTGMLIWLDVARLQHLIGTGMGWVAVAMLVGFHAALFSGVQFAIRIMLMAEDHDGRGGRRIRIATTAPALIAQKSKQ